MKRKDIVQKNVWIFQANIYFRNVNSKQPVYFPFSIKTNKCSGGCNKSMMHMKNCVFLMLLKILISEFNESCLKQDKIKFKHGKVVNIYIVCETCKNINISEWLTLTLTYHYSLMVKKFKNLKQKILRF